MNRALAILGGIGAGVAAAYFLDPKKGADRRALVRDKFNSLKYDATQKITEAAESFRQQANGFANDAKAMIGDGSHSASSKQKQQAVH